MPHSILVAAGMTFLILVGLMLSGWLEIIAKDRVARVQFENDLSASEMVAYRAFRRSMSWREAMILVESNLGGGEPQPISFLDSPEPWGSGRSRSRRGGPHLVSARSSATAGAAHPRIRHKPASGRSRR